MLDYIRTALSLIFAISVIYMLLDCKSKYQKYRYPVWGYVVVVAAVNIGILSQYGYIFFMEYYPLLIHLPTFLVFAFLSEFKLIKVFFVHCTLVGISTSFSMVGLLVSYFFDSSRDVVNIVSYILYVPTWWVIYKHLRPVFLYMLRNTNKGWVAFSLIPLSYSIILYSGGRYNLDEVDIYQVFWSVLPLSILAFSAYYVVFRFFQQTREQLELQNEQNLLKSQVTAAQLHFEALEECQEKTAVYRHDMRHHLTLIGSYLADNKKQLAQNYITKVEKDIEEIRVEQYCGNYTVNLILYSYISEAKTAGIQVETQINLPDENTVTDMDLCVIFGNGLENAIHACKGVPVEEDRFIRIQCKNKNGKLFIQIANSYEGDVEFEEGMPISKVEDHGLGTKSIAAVSEKYEGVYSFVAKDGVFTTSVII